MSRALALAALLLALCAAPAAAEPLLSEGDAAELAQSLAEATEEQGVCYGWQVQVNDDSGGPDGIDSGSSAGPGAPVGSAVSQDCEYTVELVGSVNYTCDSCESEDSSSAYVVSDLPGGPRTSDLDALGLDGGQLKGDKGDAALANMVGALPIIAASKGAAPQLETVALTGPTGAAANDRATGSPTIPDWLRESWLPLVVCLLVLVGGVWWLIAVIVAERVQRARTDRLARRRATRSPLISEPPASEDS